MDSYSAITEDGKYLIHYGVKGMKWRRRKGRTIKKTSEASTAQKYRSKQRTSGNQSASAANPKSGESAETSAPKRVLHIVQPGKDRATTDKLNDKYFIYPGRKAMQRASAANTSDRKRSTSTSTTKPTEIKEEHKASIKKKNKKQKPSSGTRRR